MFDNIINMFINMPIEFMAICFFIYGSFFGSFANVLIYRMQKQDKLNLIQKSYCPSCKYHIPFYLNIPILSWFFLKGRCQNCNKAFSFRYPLVEFLMASLFVILFLSIGWKWFLLEALIFCFALIVASFIDLDQMILPDTLTLSGILIGLLGAALNPERLFLSSLFGVFLGAGLLIGIIMLYYWIRKQEGMGIGDVKMLAWIGAVLGWQACIVVLFIACFLGSFAAFWLILGNKNNILQKAIPFGPYLALSSLLYIIFEIPLKNILIFFMF